MDQFQYIKLPDGSYGKFSSDASDVTIRGAIEKDFPDAFNAKPPSTPVPTGLAGPKDPEFKPFFSGDEARDELSGLGKSVTPTVAMAGKLLGKVPGIGKGVIDPQKVHDLEEYSKPANKGETFGKVAGTGLGILGTMAAGAPALTAAGEFGGGVMEGAGAELAPYLQRAAPVLGKIADKAIPVAKAVGKEALRALLYKSVLGGLLH